MYKCKECGNTKCFNEIKFVQTFIVLDDDGLPLLYLCQDKETELVEIFCGVCKASSEDNNILGSDGLPIDIEDINNNL